MKRCVCLYSIRRLLVTVGKKNLFRYSYLKPFRQRVMRYSGDISLSLGLCYSLFLFKHNLYKVWLLLIIMVNNLLKNQRIVRINLVKKMIQRAGKNLNKKHLVMEICVLWGVQQRKASEYIRIAEHMLK